MATAYLIVICDKDTNAVKGVEIWSSPEWEQSQRLPHPTFVAYQVNGLTYDVARHYLLRTISDPHSRYHWLVKHLAETEHS